MIDDRIIEAKEFMDDDNFINSNEFKSFLFKIKRNELKFQIKPGDLDKKIVGLIQKLQEYDPANETLTIEEARDLVRRSGMIILPRWDLSSSFLLDQIWRQEQSVSFEDEEKCGEIMG